MSKHTLPKLTVHQIQMIKWAYATSGKGLAVFSHEDLPAEVLANILAAGNYHECQYQNIDRVISDCAMQEIRDRIAF